MTTTTATQAEPLEKYLRESHVLKFGNLCE